MIMQVKFHSFLYTRIRIASQEIWRVGVISFVPFSPQKTLISERFKTSTDVISQSSNFTDGGYTPQRFGGFHVNVLWCSFCWFTEISTCDLYPDKTTPIFLFTLACACPVPGKSQKAHFLCLLVWTEYVGEYWAIAQTHWSVSFGVFATQTQITAQNNLKHHEAMFWRFEINHSFSLPSGTSPYSIPVSV